MISTLTGSSSSTILAKWKDTSPYITGYDIETKDVFAVAPGQIIYIGVEPDDTFTLNIKTNSNEILRYGQLTSIEWLLHSADYIQKGKKLGQVNKYVHFEYATTWQGSSPFPVRVNQVKYFKQDPTNIIEGTYAVRETTVQFNPSRGKAIVDYTSEAAEYEFTRVKKEEEEDV